MHFSIFEGIFFFIIKKKLRFIRENVVSYGYKCYNWDSTNWKQGGNIEIPCILQRNTLIRGVVDAIRLYTYRLCNRFHIHFVPVM